MPLVHVFGITHKTDTEVSVNQANDRKGIVRLKAAHRRRTAMCRTRLDQQVTWRASSASSASWAWRTRHARREDLRGRKLIGAGYEELEYIKIDIPLDIWALRSHLKYLQIVQIVLRYSIASGLFVKESIRIGERWSVNNKQSAIYSTIWLAILLVDNPSTISLVSDNWSAIL